MFFHRSVRSGPNFSEGVNILRQKSSGGVRIYQKNCSKGNQFVGGPFFGTSVFQNTLQIDRASKISKFPGGMPPPPHSLPTYNRPTFCICPGPLQFSRWPGAGSSNWNLKNWVVNSTTQFAVELDRCYYSYNTDMKVVRKGFKGDN